MRRANLHDDSRGQDCIFDIHISHVDVTLLGVFGCSFRSRRDATGARSGPPCQDVRVLPAHILRMFFPAQFLATVGRLDRRSAHDLNRTHLRLSGSNRKQDRITHQPPRGLQDDNARDRLRNILGASYPSRRLDRPHQHREPLSELTQPGQAVRRNSYVIRQKGWSNGHLAEP